MQRRARPSTLKGIEEHFPLAEGFTPHGASPKRRLGNLKQAVYRFAPIFEWLPAYNWKKDSPQDVAGAATLGCILVAQSLAHADLCKVDLINGPYSCIVPPVLYSIFGTCVHSSVGTGGLVSLLTGEQMMKYGDLEERTRAVGIFTLLVGLIITFMGVFRLAFMVRFLSRPALSGFITASAVLIIVSQLKPMVGLPKSDTGGLFEILFLHPGNLMDSSGYTVSLSVFSLVYLTQIKRLVKNCPKFKFLADFKELLLLGVTAVLCSKAHTGAMSRVDIVGNVPSGLPSPSWPVVSYRDLELAKEMFGGALLVALVTFLSSFAGAKKFAMQAGYQVVALNELMALGVANVGGALFGAVPTQIGLSRMGIAYSAGVQSQLGANIYVAIIVAGVLQLFSTQLYYVPRCVLNAIIVAGASHLTEFDHMYWLWSLRSTRTRQRTYVVDFAVWWIACVSTLTLGALNGIVCAVGVSLVLILYQVADPPISTLGWAEEHGRWLNIKGHEEARQRTGILVFRVEGPLFYANVETIQEWLQQKEIDSAVKGAPLKALILSAAATPFIDTTALDALRQMLQDYHNRNVSFMVANATGQPQRILKHVLSEFLPASSMEECWNVQECIQDFLKKEQERSGQATQAEVLPEVVINPADVDHVRGRATSSFLENNLAVPLRRGERAGSQSLPNMGDWEEFPGRHRARSGSTQLQPLMRSSAWVSGCDLYNMGQEMTTEASTLSGVKLPA